MSEIRKHTVRVASSGSAKRMAKELVERSKWFEVTPLPDDEWDFAVKLEEASAVEEAAAYQGVHFLPRT